MGMCFYLAGQCLVTRVLTVLGFISRFFLRGHETSQPIKPQHAPIVFFCCPSRTATLLLWVFFATSGSQNHAKSLQIKFLTSSDRRNSCCRKSPILRFCFFAAPGVNIDMVTPLLYTTGLDSNRSCLGC